MRSERRKFLVTGGAGFIGSHLAERLVGGGEDVVALDDLSTGSMDNLCELGDNGHFRFLRGDVRNEAMLDDLVRDVDVVFHLAAVVGVQLVIGHPRHVIETNVMGTECVLRASLRHGKRVLIASTSEVYGKSNHTPLAEDNDVVFGATSKPQWSYGAGKMVAEMLALAYASEYGLDVVVFRPFNVIGPRQVGRHGMVVPRFVRQALRGDALTIYGDGSQRRCFCNVGDAVSALIGLAGSERATGGVFNIGGTEEISMSDLAVRVRDLTASSSSLRNVASEDAYGPGFEDIHQRVPDISRVKELLGWVPSRSLDDILREVVAYETRKMSEISRPE